MEPELSMDSGDTVKKVKSNRVLSTSGYTRPSSYIAPGPVRRLLSHGHLLVPLGVAVVITSFLLLRYCESPLQPYGSGGAHYIEHVERLKVVKLWRQYQGGSLWEFLFQSDGPEYPPLLHLLTLPIGAVTGHSGEAILWTGLLWFFLLTVAVSSVASLITGQKRAAAAAATGTLLLPAAHGFATRYYYDLPMTALLWVAVALALGMGKRKPIIGGLLTGFVLFMAALVKWTALPFGSLMIGGALLTNGRNCDQNWVKRLWKRTIALACIVATMSLLTLWFLSGSSKSFINMSGMFPSDPQVLELNAFINKLISSPILYTLFRMPSSLMVLLSSVSIIRFIFYPLRLITSIFSPALTLPMLFLVFLWLLRKRRGLPLVLATVLGQLAFLILCVPVLDDRFALTLAPALVIAAACGWRNLKPSAQRVSAILIVAMGIWVAWDFHLGEPSLLNSARLLVSNPPARLSICMRGFGLASSVEQRGWSRADEQKDNRTAFRETLWEVVTECRVQSFGVTKKEIIEDKGILEGVGDTIWWTYRRLLAEVEGADVAATAFLNVPFCMDDGMESPGKRLGCGNWISDPFAPGCIEVESPHPKMLELALSPIDSDATPKLPRCLKEESWELLAYVADPDGGKGAAVWMPKGSKVCPALREDTIVPIGH